HTVVVANNGREALAALKQAAFDLVLMDVQMPEMNGLEATAEIRKQEPKTSPRLPIIALTAHAMKGDEERCLAAGMDAYVAKPLRVEELFAAIARLVPVSVAATVPVGINAPAAIENGKTTAAVVDLPAALALVEG